MSGSAKMFHMAPTTFHGMSSGSAMSTRQTETQGPLRGMASAMARPSGISISKDDGGEQDLAHQRGMEAVGMQHLLEPAARPAQKNTLSPKVSWTEKFTTVISGMRALNATSSKTGRTKNQAF